MYKKTYECKTCGKKIEVSDEAVPICCGNTMEQIPLDVCIQPAHAEHARPMDEEDACDDGRAG